MNGTEYQVLAYRTAQGMKGDRALLSAALGLNGEAGEVADMIKKHEFQGHEFDREHFIEELGDVMWYVALGATAVGASLDEIMEGNIKKLMERFTDGFDSERSRNRGK